MAKTRTFEYTVQGAHDGVYVALHCSTSVPERLEIVGEPYIEICPGAHHAQYSIESFRTALQKQFHTDNLEAIVRKVEIALDPKLRKAAQPSKV